MQRNRVLALAVVLLILVVVGLIAWERRFGHDLSAPTRRDVPKGDEIPEWAALSKRVATPVTEKIHHTVGGHTYDEEVTVTPYDPAGGIFFKYGRSYTSRDHQVAAFERVTGFKLPPDFLNMIGEYCEGGFNGHYRVYFKDGVEVQWHHLLLMKEADEYDANGHDTVALIRAAPKLFTDTAGLASFPFGEAYVATGSKLESGYLAFDVRQQGAIVFVPQSGGARIYIARSFREMMQGSYFVFYG